MKKEKSGEGVMMFLTNFARNSLKHETKKSRYSSTNKNSAQREVLKGQ